MDHLIRKRHGWLALLVVGMVGVGLFYRAVRRTPPAVGAAVSVPMIPVRTTAEFPSTRLDEVVKDAPVIQLQDKRGRLVSPHTGAEYLRYMDMGYYYLGNYDNIVGSWFEFTARPVEMLKKAKPSRVSFTAGLDLTHDPLDWLPPEIGLDFQGSETDEARAAGKPFHALWPKATWSELEGGDTIDIDDSENGEISVTLLARGDFNNDRIEDMMLYVAKSLHSGTFKSYEVMIVTRLKEGAPVTIIDDR